MLVIHLVIWIKSQKKSLQDKTLLEVYNQQLNYLKIKKTDRSFLVAAWVGTRVEVQRSSDGVNIIKERTLFTRKLFTDGKGSSHNGTQNRQTQMTSDTCKAVSDQQIVHGLNTMLKYPVSAVTRETETRKRQPPPPEKID